VVQRVPVKVVLNEPAPADKPLRMGLSVEVTVDISNTSGALLSSSNQRLYQENKGGLESTPEKLQLAPNSAQNGRSLLSPQVEQPGVPH